MKILVVGSGGREHALCWALARSELVEKIYCAPGNPGTAQMAVSLPIKADDVAGLVTAAEELAIDLVVVGPEVPLMAGIADELNRKGIPCFGPSRSAAMLEGSKAVSKLFLEESGIPTATYKTFTDYDKAKSFIDGWQNYPVVIKASGLAAGKGVVIAQTPAEAEATLRSWLQEGTLGDSGRTVVIEQFLAGEEVSLFVVSDGSAFQILPPAQDHKQMLENDKGPNTGGMGTVAPSHVLSDIRLKRTMERVVEPTFTHLTQRGTPFVGVLFIGLMFVGDDPYVLEYNVRFGDPETQVLMPLLNCDVGELLYAVATNGLAELQAEKRWSQGKWQPLALPETAAACVVLAARGYPSSPVTGANILLPIPRNERLVFHAGTRINDLGKLESSGGRVLNAIGVGSCLTEALENAYELAAAVHLPGKHYRHDIGSKMIEHQQLYAFNKKAKLIILGSSSGMPALDRGTSSYWLEANDHGYLLDCGEGTARSILRLGIDPDKLTSIFVSHTHPDHVAGIPMVLQMLHLQKRSKPLDLYLPADKVAIFTDYFHHLYLYEARLTFPLRILPLDDLGYSDDTLRLEVFPTTHLVKYHEDADQFGVGCTSQGFRITIADRKVVYPSDIPDLEFGAYALADADLLLIESTHIDPLLTAQCAVDHKIPRVVLTHIPVSSPEVLKEWKQIGSSMGIPLFEVAYDGLTVEF